MTELAFVHLSDLHYSRASEPNIKIILKALINDLVSLRDQHGIVPDFVIFSGDLVYAGSSREDFDLARELFIDHLMAQLNLEPDRFFLAPGNHDIDVDEVCL
jgi:3',5'-cyclic AMP phosphodiesterase CpdA